MPRLEPGAHRRLLQTRPLRPGPRRIRPWLAVATLAAAGALVPAQGATLDFQLTGLLGDAQLASFVAGNTLYEIWTLPLSGLDALNPPTVAQGDVVNASITLDQSATIAASGDHTFIQLMLGGSAFPAIDTGTTGTTAFFNAGVAGLTGGSSCTTSSHLVNCLVLHPPVNTAFSFDTVVSNFTVDVLAQPATLDTASLYVARVSNVPEPQVGAMLLLGLATLAWRRRHSSTPTNPESKS